MDNNGSLFSRLFFPLRFFTGVLFTFFWLMMGLGLGMITILGPIRWITDLFDVRDISGGPESIVVSIVIAFFAIGTALMSALLVRIYINTPRKGTRLFLVLAMLFSGLGSIYLFLNPYEFGLADLKMEVYTEHFTFGPYPDAAKMVLLKEEGYTGIISLLHPGNPLEKVLMQKEEKNAKQFGLNLIQIPMQPWIEWGARTASTEKIKKIIKSETGKYYVHCYLGKDRVSFVRRIIDKTVPKSAVLQKKKKKFSYFVSYRRFSKGSLIHIDDHTFFSPYPDTYALSKFSSSNIQYVISLLNPFIPAEAELLELEESRLRVTGIPLIKSSFQMYPYDPDHLLKITRQVKALPGPVIVHGYNTTSDRAQAFVNTYLTDKPALSYLLLQQPFEMGNVGVIQNNIAIGNRPSDLKKWLFLYELGIREFIYTGNSTDQIAVEDQETTREYSIPFEVIPKEELDLNLLARKDKTYYLYGPGIDLDHFSRISGLKNGPIKRLNTNVYITPTPTRDEFTKYFENQYTKKVYFLIGDEGTTPWIQEQIKKLESSGIKTSTYTFSKKDFSPNTVQQIAHRLWAFKGEVVLQVNPNNTYLVEAITQAYNTGVPPIPPAFFKEPLILGKAHVIASNVAIGPEPTKEEFPILKNHYGIKNFVYISQYPSPELKYQEEQAKELGLKWRHIKPDFGLQVWAHKGGPWYLYGPSLDLAYRSIQRRLGPAIPAVPVFYPDAITDVTPTDESPIIQKTIEAPKDPVSFFILRFLPSTKELVLLGPLFMLSMILLCLITGKLRASDVDVAYTRKSFHVSVFITAGILQLTSPISTVALFGFVVVCGVLYAVHRGAGFPFYEALARDADAPKKSFFIMVPLIMTGLGGIVSFLLFGQYSVVGMLVCGAGDASGEIIGRRFGKHFYKVPSLAYIEAVRTYEGSFAVFIVSLITTAIVLVILGLGLWTALWMAFVTAVVSTLVEAFSNHGIDNFTLQIASTATVYFLQMI